MYKSKIFLVNEVADELLALEETGYVTESVLQDFLTKHPDLIPGDQINQDDPRRWLLVASEMGVPGAADEGDTWSLYHLLLDQDRIPTAIESKRSTDTRIRREVESRYSEELCQQPRVG